MGVQTKTVIPSPKASLRDGQDDLIRGVASREGYERHNN